MRIFYLITKSEQGGAQTHVAQLMRFFLEHGHQIAVMSAPGGWLEQEVNRLGATFFPNPALANTANPFRLFSAARTLLKALRQFQPDLMACHSTIAGLIGRLTLRNRIPTVFTAHGWSFTQGTKTYRRLLLPWFERTAACFCEKIICVSQNDLELARTHRIASDEKLTQIYNGIEASRSLDSAPFGRFARDKKTVHILFVGRLAPPKDPLLLIKVCSQLLPEIKDTIRLTLIGDGPQKESLEKTIEQLNLQNLVILTGALAPTDVLKHLATSDIFILPTHYEGLPYTILEAMAAGVPVIASDVGGVKEAIGDDAGIIVPPNDVTALTNALKRLILDPRLRQTMGEVGFQKTQTIFSVETMCKKTLTVYSAIMNLYEQEGGHHTHR